MKYPSVIFIEQMLTIRTHCLIFFYLPCYKTLDMIKFHSSLLEETRIIFTVIAKMFEIFHPQL